MTGHAAVGIDHDLAARQTAIPLWPPDHKASRRIDQIARVPVQQAVGDERLYHLLDDIRPNLGLADLRCVLCRDENGVDAGRLTVMILYRHLRLAIRSQIAQRAVSAYLGQALGECVG